ncbi:hypothetical protein [Tomitella gaofuii]|uniref:hypothetical protein n=1 Tax=Tomitella gaofuii TaxID=2760083 RepID=UPI0015FDBA0B|nr:hypothetical protein [Tomitella gaofuii]
MGPVVFTGEVHHARVQQYLESGGTDLTQLGVVVSPDGGPIPAHLYVLRPGTTHDAPYALGGGQYTAVGACWSDAASGVGTATGWVRVIDDPGAGAQTIGIGSLYDFADALNLYAVVDVAALLAPVEQAVADFNAVVGGL